MASVDNDLLQEAAGRWYWGSAQQQEEQEQPQEQVGRREEAGNTGTSQEVQQVSC